MYKIRLREVEKAHQYEELIKVFIKPEDFVIVLDSNDKNASKAFSENDFLKKGFKDNDFYKTFEFTFKGDKEKLTGEIYDALSLEFNKKPLWGSMTGIRPVKLFSEIAEKKSAADAKDAFKSIYRVSENKVILVSQIYDYQQKKAGKADKKSVGLYIGIPFCPTRCLYCSFTSNQASENKIEMYLEALLKEIEFVGREMKKAGIFAESIYIGGGTPTTLDRDKLKRLLYTVQENIDGENLKELTLEAGRPDTIDIDKMRVSKEYGVSRVSINPQTMHDKTLRLIGRAHSADEIEKSFYIAREAGIQEINMDLIAGLPKEDLEDFSYTLDKVTDMKPENITVHTLAVKRASKLAEADKNYHYKQSGIAEKMMNKAYKKLEEKGFVPYYLYRQKHMAGAGENVGFCKPDTENLYNIRIMDEHQSILALGAGGVSKVYFPKENRLERTANVSNYEIYVERLEEMFQRKIDNFFKEVEKC